MLCRVSEIYPSTDTLTVLTLFDDHSFNVVIFVTVILFPFDNDTNLVQEMVFRRLFQSNLKLGGRSIPEKVPNGIPGFFCIY